MFPPWSHLFVFRVAAYQPRIYSLLFYMPLFGLFNSASLSIGASLWRIEAETV